MLYKILMALFVLMVLTNPLSVQVIQPEVFRAWDWVVGSAGWMVTAGFSVYFTFLLGYVVARQQLKDAGVQKKNISKAQKKKRSLDGMKYEMSGRA